MKSTGIFRRIPSSLASRERKTAIKLNKSLDGMATGIYHHFFVRMIEAERIKVFADMPDKTMGRKVK